MNSLRGVGRAATDHGAVQDIESGEQGGGAVALVVMGHGPAFARLQRQAGLGVRGSNLAHLVDGHDDGVSGRVHVKANNILDRGAEKAG